MTTPVNSRSPKNEIAVAFWKNVLKDAGHFFKNIWFLWLLATLTAPASFFISSGNLKGFANYDAKGVFTGINFARIFIVIAMAFLVALSNYVLDCWKKRKEKKEEIDQLNASHKDEIDYLKEEFEKVKTTLDRQYDYAFKFSNYCIYYLYEVVSRPTKQSIDSYLTALTTNISQIVLFILEANKIGHNSMVTTNLMVKTLKSSRAQGSQSLLDYQLKTVVFGPPGRAGRHYRATDLYKNQQDLTDNKPTPGAPTALSCNNLVYIPNTQTEELKTTYPNLEYHSFFSLPISENESDGGNNFAVLNIDSPVVDQFVSDEFIGEKITPALRPFTACIKLLHKLGYI